MKDNEICSVLHNLVVNGLEAASNVKHDFSHVALQAVYTDLGYEIKCINECIGKADLSKTTKEDKREHGLGVGIVTRIVKKYHGTMQIDVKETEETEVYLVVITIQIPCARVKEL